MTRSCIGEAALASEGLIGPRQVEWFDRLREDLDNYRTALARLIEQGRAAEASDMAWAMMFFWLIRGHATEGLRWYEQILSLRPLPPNAEAKALLGAAAAWHAHAEPERARSCLIRTLGLARDSGDRAAAAAEKGDDAWVARILGARHTISERAGATPVDPVRSAVSANGDRHVSIRPASPGISKLVHRLVDCGRSERPPGSAKTARLVPSAWTSCSQEAI